MAEGYISEGAGIAKLAATETLTGKYTITSIILTGTAAGSFVFDIDDVALTITTGTADLTKVIPMNKTVNRLELTSGPTGAAMIVFIAEKS
jgi:hypothetical protein